MSNCPHTGLTIPECACPRCIERQLEQFAPGRARMRTVSSVPSHPLGERAAARFTSVAERLTRPAL